MVAPGRRLPLQRAGSTSRSASRRNRPHFIGQIAIVDSSTLLRRTPAGDAEAAVPANGLSLTQRRILTLLEKPNRLADLSVGTALDPNRLQRDAARLAQAGFIACDASAIADGAVAANAGNVASVKLPLVRPLPAATMVLLAVAIVWAGLRFIAPPAAPDRNPAAAPPAPAVSASATAPVPTPDPKVIATRVLRSDPRGTAAQTKPATDPATAAAPAATTESRTDTFAPAKQKD